jgi:flagellar protein FlbD
MITLHRIGHQNEPFLLNDDLIVTVEATPDTVITLSNNHKIVVSESPDEVAKAIRIWRASILSVVPPSA